MLHAVRWEGEFELAFILEHDGYEYIGGMISIFDYAAQESFQRPVTGTRDV